MGLGMGFVRGLEVWGDAFGVVVGMVGWAFLLGDLLVCYLRVFHYFQA
jgi:hypothetical protein